MARSSRDLIKSMSYNALDEFDLTSDKCISSYVHETINESKDKTFIERLGIVDELASNKNKHLPENYRSNTDNMFSSTSNPLLIEYNGNGDPIRVMWENPYLDTYDNWTMSTGSLGTQFNYRNHYESREENIWGRRCERCGKPLNFFERNTSSGVCNKCETEMGWKPNEKATNIRLKLSEYELDDLTVLKVNGKLTDLNDFKNLRGYLVEN